MAASIAARPVAWTAGYWRRAYQTWDRTLDLTSSSR